MTTIVTRAGKGSPLTNVEVDANFTNLNNDKLEKTGGTITANSSSAALTITQTGTGNALVVEDSASPDTSPFVIDQSGNVVIGHTAALNTGVFSGTSSLQKHGSTLASQSSLGLVDWRTQAAGPAILSFAKSISGTIGTRSALVAIGSALGTLSFSGDDGTAWAESTRVSSEVDAAPAAGSMPGRLVFSTTPSGLATPVEALRINSGQNFGFNHSGSLGGGSGKYRFSGNITGSTNSIHVLSSPTFLSDSTTTATVYSTLPTTQDAAVQYGALIHYQAAQGTVSGGTRLGLTAQTGFRVLGTLIGATNNYGFASEIPAGTGRWNFYAAGTAANYFAGNVTANAAFNQTPTRSTAASGSTVTLTTGTNHLLYDQAGTVAALTVTLPSASLSDGQVITIATRSEITSLTINGGTIYGAPTTLAAGGFCSFIYSSGGAAWFRKG